MPDLSRFSTAAEKRLDITAYFGEEAFLTLRRLPELEMKMLNYKSGQRGDAQLIQKARELIEDGSGRKKIKDSATTAAVNKIIGALTPEEIEQYARMEVETDEMCLNSGIDPDKHNFLDGEGKKIKLDRVFWANVGKLVFKDGEKDSPKLRDFVITQVIHFNMEAVRLGE